MKYTKFLDTGKLMLLVDDAQNGDKEAAMKMFDEIIRLKNIIKDYENSLYNLIELANKPKKCPSS